MAWSQSGSVIGAVRLGGSLGAVTVAGSFVAGCVFLAERAQEGTYACNGRRHDGITHLPLCCDQVLKGMALASKPLVEVVQSNAGSGNDWKAGGKGEDDDDFGLEAHLQGPDQLDSKEEDEDLGGDVECAYGLPFQPLRGSALQSMLGWRNPLDLYMSEDSGRTAGDCRGWRSA